MDSKFLVGTSIEHNKAYLIDFNSIKMKQTLNGFPSETEQFIKYIYI